MQSLSRNQIEALLKSGADDLQIAKTIAIQSKPDQTKTLVGGVMLALLANVVVPGLGPIIVLALTADAFLQQRRKADEVSHKIERGEVWEFIPESDRAHFATLDPERKAIEVAARPVEPSQDKPAAPVVALPAESGERSLFMHLADNPFLCWFILASQRTGKTSSAAAASLTIKRESATEVYYVNLSDHGQGNREAFAHADKMAVGNINGGNSNDVAKLIELAIAVVEKFHESNNAILIVDEWVSLATKGRGILDEFWAVLAPKADALTSNGIGCGRSVWAIAPRFQAATMRDDAKIVKNFKPLLLAIAPGQIVEWKNPNNGTTAKLDYNGALVGQAIKNWPESDITEPTAEDTRRWQRDKVSRIFWADGQWSALGQAPAIPKRAAANPDETNAATSVEQRQTVAKLEQDLAAKLTPPVIDLMPICIDKIAANNGYITLAKLRNSLSKSQQAAWDDDFEASLLQDNRVKWEDVPISGGRVSTRLEYSDANANSE